MKSLFGLVSLAAIVALLIAVACGGGGDGEAAPTATPTRPAATATPTSPPCPIEGGTNPVEESTGELAHRSPRQGDGRYSETGEYRTDAQGNPRPHVGIDIVADVGTPVFPVADGIVFFVCPAEDCTESGNQVVIDHGEGLFSRYFHLEEIRVTAGQQVFSQGSQRTRIGTVGTTGNAVGTDQPHLHLEIREGHMTGESLDPTGCAQSLEDLVPGTATPGLPEGTLDGTWTGTATQTDAACDYEGTMTMVLNQSGSTVTGSISLALALETQKIAGAGCPPVRNGAPLSLSGTVSGSKFTFNVPGTTFSGEGTLRGNIIEGTTSVTSAGVTTTGTFRSPVDSGRRRS
ncbi:MAG: M23 family metallopeptidase [Dehalococcoidia bacterium]